MSDPSGFTPALHAIASKTRAKQAERQRLDKLKSSGDDLSELYGSAKLYEGAGLDLSPLAGPDGALATPLGRDPVAGTTGLYWDLEQLQGHSITFGATRSGKGVNSIIPALLSYSGSMLVIDPKAENAWATMERRKDMGQRIVVLDPWGECQKRYGDNANPRVEIATARFNPLAALDPSSEDFADDVTAIAEALVIPGLGEAHWTDSARELICGVVALVCERYPGRASLGIVRQVLSLDSKTLIEVIQAAAKVKPEALSTRKLARFAEATNEVSSVRAVATTQTAILDSVRLVESMASDDIPFDLAELGTGRVTLYLVLPLDRLETHGRWLRLIITMAIRTIAKQAEPPSAPVYFMLDEAGTIGPLRMVEQAFGLMAGAGIRVSLYLQDLTQLQRDYPKSWETFISNSSVVTALKVTDITTSEYISKLMGTKTLSRISGETMQIRQGEKGLLGKPGDPEATTISDQVHSRPLMLPQEVRDKIGPNRVLVILPGYANYLMQRTPYYAPDSIWQGLYRAPPKFAEGNAAAVAAWQAANAPPPPPVEKPKKGWFG